jgi:hypothetical protein
MSGFAVPATILYLCEQHRGDWLTLATLSARMALGRDRVQTVADAMVDAGQLQFAITDGEPQYGIGVEGKTP